MTRPTAIARLFGILHRDLCTQGLRITRHRLARLMRLHDIRGVCRRRAPHRPRTAALAIVMANVLQRDFTATHRIRSGPATSPIFRRGRVTSMSAVLLDALLTRTLQQCQFTVGLEFEQKPS